MLHEMIASLRGLAFNRNRRLLDHAYTVAAGGKVPPETIALALQEAGKSPQDAGCFFSLVEVARRRSEMRRDLAQRGPLEAEREKIMAEVAKHNKKLEAAEEAHAQAVGALDVRLQQIRRQLRRANSSVEGALIQECPDPEIVEAIAKADARLREIDNRLPLVEKNTLLRPHQGMKLAEWAEMEMEETVRLAKAELAALLKERPEIMRLREELNKKAMEA